MNINKFINAQEYLVNSYDSEQKKYINKKIYGILNCLNYLSITKNYRVITLTEIAAKIYNLILLNMIRLEIDPILRKNQNGFRTNRLTTGQILTIRCILEEVKSKNLPLTLFFIDFSKLLTR